MKKRVIPAILFKVATLLPLILAAALLALAYTQFQKGDAGQSGAGFGTLGYDTAWKVHLKDNQFYPTDVLGEDYAYIKELVDKIQLDMDYTLFGAPDTATSTVSCRIEGTLRADYEAQSSSQVLMQEYPNLLSETRTYTGSFHDTLSFPLSLDTYDQVINSFQSAYQLTVKAKLDMNIFISVTEEANGQRVTDHATMTVTIPINSSIFQISGSPGNTLRLDNAYLGSKLSSGIGSGVLIPLCLALLMLVAAAAAYVFLAPAPAGHKEDELKKVLQKCKGNLIKISADPRETGMVGIPVEKADDLPTLAEEYSQSILYLQKDAAHTFFIQIPGIMFVHEITVHATGDSSLTEGSKKSMQEEPLDQ